MPERTALNADGASAVGASGDGASADADDARLRRAREEAGVTAILHESVPVRYWDHDLGPAQLRLFAAEPAAPGRDGVTGLNGLAGLAELRDLTPAPGRALDQQSFCVSADGRTVATGWWRRESHGESHAELTVIDIASAARRTLLSAPGFDYEHPAISPDGRYVACIRSAHHAPEAPGDVTIDAVPVWERRPPWNPPLRCAPRWGCPPIQPALAGPEARTRWPVTIASPWGRAGMPLTWCTAWLVGPGAGRA